MNWNTLHSTYIRNSCLLDKKHDEFKYWIKHDAGNGDTTASFRILEIYNNILIALYTHKELKEKIAHPIRLRFSIYVVLDCLFMSY